MALLTTCIGAYPKPSYVAIPDWFTNPQGPDCDNPTELWATAMAELGEQAEAVFSRGTRQVIQDQIDCGIDIPTDGEIRRENYIHYHCRHLQGISFNQLTEKVLREGSYTAKLPTIIDKIRAKDRFLAHDWRVAQQFTNKPVKITLPGPLTISDTVANHYYADLKTLGQALADAINIEILDLATAGCKHIQIDEPVFARRAADALAFGIENLERAFYGCPDSVVKTVHICCGYPDRIDNPHYPKAPQQAYHQLATSIDQTIIDAVSLEDAHRHNDLKLLERFRNTTVIFGAVAIAKSEIESVDTIRQRLKEALEHIDAHRLIAAPDCGLGILGRSLARAKLKNLCAAAQMLPN